MKKFYIFFVLIVFLLFINFSLPAGAAADSKFNQGLNATSQGAGYPAAAAANPVTFLAQMLGGALAPMFMGVIAMVILIYGGYTWMTARGEEQKVEKAKAIIINTIIAVVIVFSAYAIVKLIIPLWTHVT